MSSATAKNVSSSPTTCIVGCKLPHGLHLELKDNRGRTIRHTLNGMNNAKIIGGYGLTDNIPTEFMQEWLRMNSEHPAVVNGSIFMHNDTNGAVSRAKEGREIRTGLEAINPLDEATRKRFSIVMDKKGEADYRKQVAENPVRNRQIVE